MVLSASANIRFDPVVSSLVNSISLNQMRDDIRWLTGEDGKSGIISRHSFAEGSRLFISGFAPNVACKYSALVGATSTVLISEHYDSRGSFGSQRAPGGNDDGSGTVTLLRIACAIAHFGLTFRSNIELVAFAGEEQGLYGSKAYAREMREKDASITVMIQADMVGYHA
ncbi:putative aminopeptidase [Suillus occidentalis]|nr:putative aminopeptidase [Suillus occidentalis]